MSKPKTYDKKIFRLWAVLNKLDSGKKIYSSKLAEEFNVSIRSIQRDIELLNMVGFPVVSSEKGCWAFTEGFSLKRIMISEEDASLLSFLFEVARSLGGKFENSFNGILKKMITPDTESAFYVKMPGGMKLSEEYPHAEQIESAIDESRRIKIDYNSGGEEKEYVAEPLKMIYYDGFWYMLAKIDAREWLRKFRLDNIENVEETKEYFDVPDNLKTVLDESVNVWFEEKRNRKVVLKVDAEAAEYFRRKTYIPCQSIKKEQKDGSILVEAMIAEDMEIIPTILYWIPRVKVISPQALKDKVFTMMKGYLKDK